MMWEKVKLVDICNPKQWKTISTDMLTQDGYPVYGANGIIGFYKDYTHESPTVMITCRGATCGNIHISKPFSYINGNAMALDNLSSKVSLRYLYYFLLSYDFKNIISGSAQPQITIQGLQKLEIPLPPLHIQEQIADTLDKADALRRKDQELLQKYDELAQAIFYDMFGDPVRNEKGWLLSNLEELVYNCNNKRIPVKESDRSQLKKIYPYYGASGIIDYVENYLFEGQHLLVGEDGANLLSRSTPIAFLASEKFWVNNHAHVMREKNVPLEFIETVINCTDLTPYVSGSAQPKLTREKLDSIPIINPPGKLVQGYVEKLNNLRNAMGLIKKQNVMSEQLFLGTSRKYFS